MLMKEYEKLLVLPLFHKISTFLSTEKNKLVHGDKKAFFPFCGQVFL